MAFEKEHTCLKYRLLCSDDGTVFWVHSGTYEGDPHLSLAALE